MLRGLKRVVAVVLMAVVSLPCSAGMWAALPIDVHEWGVNEFDWGSGKAGTPEIPGYMYTDKRPGKVTSAGAQRVKDMPPDSGIRTKPILYFYPRGRIQEMSVGVEVRFAFGYANAWWPQVSVYRTPEDTAKAKPVDWEAWRKKQTPFRQNVRVPDDERFELVWHNLKLTKGVPDGVTYPKNKVAQSHWASVARAVDAHYVSNGKEAERYVFYEGKTRESPALTILPSNTKEGEKKTWSLVNISDFPIHDVILIYRTKRRGPVWVGYMGTLRPIPKADKKNAGGWGHHVEQVMAMEIPDLANLPKHQVMSDDAFEMRTSKRLIEALSAGKHLTEQWYSGMRDPGDPQPPTKMHMLYRKEAVALEKIWRKDFFQSEGLTIIYRESTEYLDKAMPLNIYTSMFHYVRLSRCGLVLNRNVTYRDAEITLRAVTDNDVKTSRVHRLLALGQAQYLLRTKPYLKHLPKLIEALQKP